MNGSGADTYKSAVLLHDRRPSTAALLSVVLALAVSFGIAACGDGATGSSGARPGVPVAPPDPVDPGPGGPGDDCTEFAGTFEAIQEVIFENRGCTADVCHGSSAAGGLDLRAGVSHASLVETSATGASALRVVPGDRDRSYLYAKLAAATLPGSVDINGSPMPSGLPPLSEDELTALRLWIAAGAPAEGTVEGTQDLLDACLPDAEPITILPLAPPAPDEGVQFVMPPVELPAGSEQELCFATYYDFTGQIPERFLDPTGEYFRIDAQELRQDPASHHLVLSHSGVPIEDIDDPAFPAWTCAGGAAAGTPCDPLDLESCGSGICRTEPVDSFACIGFGPASVVGLPTQGRNIGGAQEAQAYQALLPGVFGQVAISGIAFWNSHAFNLTTKSHTLNGRLNIYFAEEQRFPVVPLIAGNATFSPNMAPFTEGTICRDHTLPQGARLFSLTSHNHKRGIHFWADLPDGARVYENFLYSDPVRENFDPPLAFDSPDRADRTLTYCATFNNGLNEDGSPNVETVTRASRIPPNPPTSFLPGGCEPIACVAGQIGAACTEDADCDSAPGAEDGWCDACPITGGESTENEMFILLGQMYIADGFPQPPSDGFVGVGF